jgi:hypothetical protein
MAKQAVYITRNVPSKDTSELYTNNMVCRYSACSRTTKLFHVVEPSSGAVIDLAGYVPPGGTKCGGGGDVGNC